jgi:putative sugar O-methyltransferase
MQEIYEKKPRIRDLIKKYHIPYSLLGGCLRTVKIDGCIYSLHYLNILDQHDSIAAHTRFDTIRSIFEIGGGFGANIHLLIENYPSIKKVVYLDIPPNLYVATQYLKAFYGKSVFDYQDLKKRKNIEFSDTDDLEIFCIAPWQIEKIHAPVDIFLNSHSFVEMSDKTVLNYANHIMRLSENTPTIIALVTYDNFNPATTLDPDTLPAYFPGRKFTILKTESLMDPSRYNFYYLSPE